MGVWACITALARPLPPPAWAGYLVNAEAKGLAKATARRMESGHVCLRYEGQVREVYEMAVIGLAQLEKSYPELVKVTLPPG